MIYPTARELKKFDVDEFAKVLMTLIDGMSQDEQKAIMQALSHCKVKEDYWFLYQYLDKPHVWRMPMVSIDTFICDNHFLGKMTKQGTGIYPVLRKMARDIMRGGYTEVAAVCGLGSGKSMISSLIATYLAHHLLCLRNPHQFYKLVKDKPIGIMNMGLTATQALKVVFESVKNFISNSDFFDQLQPKIGSSGVIKFEKEQIEIISGNSKATTQLGFNLFCGILDEASFYYEDAKAEGNSANNEKTNVAQGLYEGLRARISSRFGSNGLIMMISSPRIVADYIMDKLADSREVDKNGAKKFPNIYGVQLPTWKVKNQSVYEGDGTFLFNTRDNTIVTESIEEIEKTTTINKISDPTFDYANYIWEIPNAFKAEFSKNPNKSKRDIGAFPSEAVEGFLIPERVTNAFNMERPDVVLGDGKYSFQERPLRTNYFIHIDIGLNRDGTGDFTGFVMGHANGWEVDEATKERRLQIQIDLIERIGVKKGEQEVSIADIRERIYILKEMGYRIGMVTLDGYQSKEMFQILKKKGVRAEYLSVDRTIDPYNMLRESIYEKRIDMYYNEHLHRELVQLEEVSIGSHTKVDHPKGGGKDLSDALAGCVYDIMENTSYSPMNMANAPTAKDVDPNTMEYMMEKQKLKDIELRRRMNERQQEMEDRIFARQG